MTPRPGGWAASEALPIATAEFAEITRRHTTFPAVPELDAGVALGETLATTDPAAPIALAVMALTVVLPLVTTVGLFAVPAPDAEMAPTNTWAVALLATPVPVAVCALAVVLLPTVTVALFAVPVALAVAALMVI